MNLLEFSPEKKIKKTFFSGFVQSKGVEKKTGQNFFRNLSEHFERDQKL